MKVYPFRLEHLTRIKVYRRFLVPLSEVYEVLKHLDEQQARELYEIAYTAFDENDAFPMACCGINRGCAWAFISPHMTRQRTFLVTRHIQKVLKRHSLSKGPVVAVVDPGFALAVRWARTLGFRKVEGGNLWVYDALLS